MTKRIALLRVGLIVCFVPLLLFTSTRADYTRKWGRVEPEILAMMAYPPDSLAEAVIVFDVGEMELSLRNRLEFTFKRHYQIKVLNESGFSYADVVIPAWHEDKVIEIKAHTILPSGKKHKLKSREIHTEKTSDNWRLKKFTLPNIQTGAIIEVQYKIISKHYLELDPWYFQSDIPTLESTAILKIAPGFSYTYKVYNDSLGRIESTTDEYMDVDFGTSLKRFIFRGSNLPAVREAPYISSLDNYKAQLKLQFLAYKDNTVEVSFIKDLPTLCRELLETEFGSYLETSGEVRARAEKILGDAASESDSLNALFAFVRDSVEDESYSASFYPQKNQKEVLSAMRATSAERNLLLLAILKSAGYDATPVLISTRDHGDVDPRQLFLNQYNHIIVLLRTLVAVDLLDATDRFIPLGKLPPRSLITIGLIVDKNQPQLIRIPNTTLKSKETVQSKIQIGDVLTLYGTSGVTSEGYACWRRNWQVANAETTEAFLLEHFDPVNGNISFSEPASELLAVASDTFSASFDFTLHQAIEEIEGELYLRPALFHGLRTNPFSLSAREFPVDFGYRSQQTEACQIEIGGRYEVEHLPADVWISSEYVSYKRMITKVGPSQLNYVRILQIKKPTVPPSRYETLRADFAKIVDADAGQIILKPVP